MVSEINIFAND